MIGIIGAIMTGFILGILTEKWIIKPVYGNHVQQILITLGLMLVLSEMLKVIWGPNQMTVAPPDYLKGSWEWGGIIIIKYRVFIILIGLLIFAVVQFILKKQSLALWSGLV